MTSGQQPRSSGRSPGAETWGWELREPVEPPPAPFDVPAPAPGSALPRTRWLRRSAQRRDRISDSTARTVGLGVAAAAFVTGAVLLQAQFGGTGWYDGFGWVATLLLVLLSLVMVLLAVQPLLISVWSEYRYRGWRKRLLVKQAQLADRAQEWERRRIEHEHQTTPTDTQERWVPLRPLTRQRVDVFGGTPHGRALLVRQVVGTLVAGGDQVWLLDLAQDQVAVELRRRLDADGVPYDVATVPDDLPPSDLLAGMPPAQVGDLIAEAVHALDTSSGGRPGGGAERSMDATLVERICDCLDGRPAADRLLVALRALARRQPTNSPTGGGLVTDDMQPEQAGLFTGDEGLALTRLAEELDPESRSRLGRLAAVVTRLASADRAAQPAPAGRGGNLRVWQLSDQLSQTESDMLAQAVFLAVLYRIRAARSGDGRQVLVVAGCDRIRRGQLDQLDQVARARGVRLILLFAHLREESVDMLGGGEAALFLRLGNAKEAENAASFIGKQHRLVASSFTVSRSTNWSTSTGTSTSATEGENESTSSAKTKGANRNYHNGLLLDWPYDSGSRNRGTTDTISRGTNTSETTGTSTTEQQGASTSESLTYQRTYEFSVEPTILQGLSPTAFLMIDPADQGSPRLGDCAPEIEPQALRSLHQPGSSDPVARSLEQARHWANQPPAPVSPASRTAQLPGIEESEAQRIAADAARLQPDQHAHKPLQ